MTSATYKAVIFDFDGTLADTAPDMIAALNSWLAARECCALNQEQEEQARALCSGGSRALLNFCGIGSEDIQEAITEYLQHYENTDYSRTTLYPGVTELIKHISASGLRWGVATNKPQRYFAPIAARLLAPLQPAALIARDDANFPPKPHPATLLAAAEQCAALPQQCVYVGDDLRDGIAAQAAEMPFIAATWGYWQPAQWQQQQECPPIAATISRPAQLAAVIFAA